MLARARDWARAIKRDVVALWIAARDPRTPQGAKIAAGAVAAYALSPIDLIPDFIPIVGYLDEVILLPIAIALIVQLIPSDLMDEYRATAMARSGRPTSRGAMIAIILVWVAVAIGLVWWLAPLAGDWLRS